MKPEEIKHEAIRLSKKADDMEYFATTLTYGHQIPMVAELKEKASEIRELQKEYERMLNNNP